MKELTKEEVKNLENGTMYVIYNPLTEQYKIASASKNDIAHSKYCYEKLKFYLVDEETRQEMLKGE